LTDLAAPLCLATLLIPVISLPIVDRPAVRFSLSSFFWRTSALREGAVAFRAAIFFNPMAFFRAAASLTARLLAGRAAFLTCDNSLLSTPLTPPFAVFKSPDNDFRFWPAMPFWRTKALWAGANRAWIAFLFSASYWAAFLKVWLDLAAPRRAPGCDRMGVGEIGGGEVAIWGVQTRPSDAVDPDAGPSRPGPATGIGSGRLARLVDRVVVIRWSLGRLVELFLTRRPMWG
jgi:hypothetical protein